MRNHPISTNLSFALSIGLALLISTTAAHAAQVKSSDPGKKSVFVAEEDGVSENFGDIVELTGTIAKAGTGILAIETQLTMFSDATNGTTGIYSQILINGNSLAPFTHPFSAPGPEVNCGTGHSECTITATHWVDLDAAEAAFPGSVKGLPLTVTMRGGVLAGPGSLPYRASFSARTQKK
jgi:hypothetical protein